LITLRDGVARTEQVKVRVPNEPNARRAQDRSVNHASRWAPRQGLDASDADIRRGCSSVETTGSPARNGISTPPTPPESRPRLYH
jgi:hypothetical protein